MANELKELSLRTEKWKGADRWLSDGGSRGAGRLVAKVGAAPVNGAKKPGTRITFYFSYFNGEGARRFLLIGEFPRISLKEARNKAAEHSALHQNGTVDLHAHYAAIRDRETQARRDEQEARQEADRRARSQTLRELLDAYSGHLKREGKQSAGDVQSIFKLHVLDARADLAERRAAEIPVDEFVSVLGTLTKAGKGRTAAKLRSYLRAAYSLAIRSKTDPDAPLELRTFGIEVNPIASIGAMSKYNRAGTRNLSVEELRAFLKRLEGLPQSVKKDALLLCLLLGGQRPIQLLRLKPVDADLSAETITLYDSKGSRRQPRAHVLPLSKKTSAIVKRGLELHGEAPTVFSSDGKRQLRSETVSAVVTEISAAMVKAKEAREGFELRDLRRTCETRLAALGVSSDIRAQLQSHGLGGIQQRHYDKYGYMLEKRAALVKWQRHIDRIVAGKMASVARPAFGRKPKVA